MELVFQDGAEGDDDCVENGTIVDDGGPAYEQESPSLSLNPMLLNFFATPGGPNPDDQTFHLLLSSLGTEEMTFTITDSAVWLTVSPAIGTLENLSTLIIVEIRKDVQNCHPRIYKELLHLKGNFC